jgi:hypothetical protein
VRNSHVKKRCNVFCSAGSCASHTGLARSYQPFFHCDITVGSLTRVSPVTRRFTCDLRGGHMRLVYMATILVVGTFICASPFVVEATSPSGISI